MRYAVLHTYISDALFRSFGGRGQNHLIIKDLSFATQAHRGSCVSFVCLDRHQSKQNHKLMEQKEAKQLYCSPEANIFEIKQEGVICASGGEYPQWNDENI